MASDTPPICVLVVEDELLLRADFAETLRHEGFDVIEASNADEAVKMLENNFQIRLIFTDIEMPGEMNGIKLAAAVRKRWPPVRIIATSGHFKARAGDFPEDAMFFAKPYRSEQIVQAIRELTSLV